VIHKNEPDLPSSAIDGMPSIANPARPERKSDMIETRLALVTGAARGIGRAITERLATAGYGVIAVDALSEPLHLAATELKGRGLDVRPIVFDLADSEGIARLPSMIGDGFDKIAVLVNNAGISPKHNGTSARLCDIALAEWDRVMRVNLTAPFRLTQLCLPPMRSRRWGRIVNISSKGGRTPSGVAGAHYVSSKSGIFGLTKITAMEVAGDGITVNSIAPGRIETPMEMEADAETRARSILRIPVGRLGKAEEIAAAVAFLVSDEAGYVTGATFDINGGTLMI
jgi:3-oxoacyl-[acyl-carrier protein] reductase